MEKNALYLLQVSGCIVAFYLVYITIFKKSTSFRANRIYLLAALLLSFAIPISDFASVPTDFHLPSSDFFTVPAATQLQFKAEYVDNLSWAENFNFLIIIYWVGFAFFIARFLYSLGTLFLLIKRSGGVCRQGAYRIIRIETSDPFSFFNLIFLPKGEIDPLIINHEKAHVRFHHWFDLMLIELASAILWFNPVMIFYKKSIKIQHEYEADNHVVRNGASIQQYLSCILQHLQAENSASPISQFYSPNIKKRIVMLTTKKNPLTTFFGYIVFVPLTCLLLFAFAKPSIHDLAFPKNLNDFGDPAVVIVVDAGHGGNDSGTSADGLLEKEFALAIAKNIRDVSEGKNVKVVLTRTGDNAMTLAERVDLANHNGADAFISIHANYDKESAMSSGIQCVVSENNGEYQDSQRLAEQLIRELKTLNGISVNGIKKSNAYVLSNNKMPAILLELGFFSNKSDYAFMRDLKNQQQISERIVSAVLQYKK
jgi:N-acetylmuramoyl-L-alanine amidase